VPCQSHQRWKLPVDGRDARRRTVQSLPLLASGGRLSPTRRSLASELLMQDELSGPGQREPIEFSGMENLHLAAAPQEIFGADWLLGSRCRRPEHLLCRRPCTLLFAVAPGFGR